MLTQNLFVAIEWRMDKMMLSVTCCIASEVYHATLVLFMCYMVVIALIPLFQPLTHWGRDKMATIS